VIFEKVKERISDILGVESDDITMESSFVDDLGADSLDLVELIMALEEEFEIEIPDEEAEKIQSVSDVVEYIKEHTDM
jgi:acyl carrier protein